MTLLLARVASWVAKGRDTLLLGMNSTHQSGLAGVLVHVCLSISHSSQHMVFHPSQLTRLITTYSHW